MEYIDIALLIMRLWAGFVIIAHGINHGRSLKGTAAWFAKVGFKAPQLIAFISSAMEITVGLALIFGRDLNWSALTILGGMLLTAMFALGVGLIVATLGAFFLDIRLTYQVLLTGWFYATPIIYTLAIVPEGRHWLFHLNPVLHLVELVRQPIYYGVVAPPEHWLIATLVSSVTLIVGWASFTHWRNAFDYRR